MSQKKFSARNEACEILMQIMKNDGYASVILDRRIRLYPPTVDIRDQALVTHLVYETLSHIFSIDAMIDQHASLPVGRMKPYIACTLRIAVQQMCYDERIPNRAAINEAVSLVGASKFRDLKGFVNGVLRAIDRDACRIRMPDDPWEAFEITYNLPAWLLKRWDQAYGREQMLHIAALCNTKQQVHLRVNTLKTTREAVMEELQEDEPEPSALLPEMLRLKRAAGLAQRACIRDGRAVVQNESAALAAAAADVRPGMRVLDLCAAPGGKSTFMAQRMENQGEIISCDLYPQKVETMKEQAVRMGLSCMVCLEYDALHFEPEWAGQFDRVIVDAPCSGWGVVRNKPDIRIHRKEQEIAEILSLERRILDTASRYVKPSGKLIYSTCTLDASENEQMADAFLHSHEDYQAGILEKDLPSIGMCDTIKNHDREVSPCTDAWRVILPEAGGRDGFFIASFTKREMAEGTPAD